MANCFILHPCPLSPSFTFRLSAKPKSGGKVQVRLLQTVSGTGNQNEVVHVAPAYFENVLKKKKLGVKVTDEEVKEFENEKKAKDDENMKTINAVKSKIDGKTFEVKRKAGEDGRLFGSVSVKDVLKLMENIEGVGKGKVHVDDKEGIKTVGEWGCKWTSGKVEAKFKVEVVKEE